MKAAELKTSRRNALKDSDFAIPGKRKLPIHDESHVRNALSRFGQTKGLTPDERATAKSRIKAAAKKFGITVSDDFSEYAVYAQPLLVACGEHEVDTAAFREGKPLPLVKVGEHDFRDSYGLVAVTVEDLDHMVEGFGKNARRQDLPLLNEEHIPATYSDTGEVLMGPGAIGWISKVYREGDTLYGVPDWNPAGEALLAQDRYRAVSPELLLDWTDPETGEQWGMTLAGAALTTMPRMKHLAHQGAPLAAGEARVLAFAERPVLLAADDGGHGSFTGTHSHSHPAFGAQGDDQTHSHQHSHDGDAGHEHEHDMAELTDTHVDRFTPGFSVAYAYPAQRRLPLHTAEAVKGARARFLSVDAAEGERDEAWKRVHDAARQLGVAVPADWRELRASECAQLLMQEGDMDDDMDEDVAGGMLAPCCYQPPYSDISRCPGFTRDDPDNDGDSDCCAMAAKGCNGYVPLVSRATLVSPQAPSYYGERRPGGTAAVSGNRTTTKDDKAPVAGAADDARDQQRVTAAEPSKAGNDQGGRTDGGKSQGHQDPALGAGRASGDQGAQARGSDEDLKVADFREVQAILAAERRARQAAEQIAQDALKAAETARNQVEAIQTATRLSEVAGRLEALVKTGRITPAERDLYSGENLARFSEHAWLLEALEQRPEGKAVNMEEKGSGTTGPLPGNRSAEIDQRARALMAERKQSTDPRNRDFYRNYRTAAADAAQEYAEGAGFRG